MNKQTREIEDDYKVLSLKVLMSIDEASRFYGIGQKCLRNHFKTHPEASEEILLQIGSTVRLKRKKFEEYLDRVQVM
ncbi:excisionase [Faecalitalea cylindroides]|uniref:excisionase n=1 Tax=Faecalitalea cylindroides TaxID=39483 RepID=UPI0039931285